MAQRILNGSTDSLLIYPESRWLGVPSAASVKVQTPAVAYPSSADNATIDSVSATTNAATDAGNDTLSFASDPTCTAGRYYLLTSTTGEKAVVEVVQTGTTVQLAEPLTFDAPSGSSLKGIAITHALTAAETATNGMGVVEVIATIGGVQRKWKHEIEIKDRFFAVTLNAAKLTKSFPEVRRLRSSSDETLGEIIMATADMMIGKLQAAGFDEDRINRPQSLEVLHGRMIVWRLKEAGMHPPEEIEAARTEFYRELSDVSANKKFWYSDDDDSPGSTGDTSDLGYVRFVM